MRYFLEDIALCTDPSSSNCFSFLGTAGRHHVKDGALSDLVFLPFLKEDSMRQPSKSKAASLLVALGSR